MFRLRFPIPALPRCAFNPAEYERGTAFFFYPFAEALRPDSVTASAFALSNKQSGEETKIENVIYEAATNKVTLLVENKTLAMPCAYTLSTAEGLLAADGTAVAGSATLYPGYSCFAEEGTVSVISLQYKKDDRYITGALGQSDFTVEAVAVNTSSTAYNSLPYTVYADSAKTKVLASGTADFNAEGFATFSVRLSGYTMLEDDSLTIDFTI